jgi:selT/selW/selH-like putative selenoprotein
VVNERTEHQAEIAEGETGQFDVRADGRLVFSKQREGRFPDEDEIIRELVH